MAAARVRQSCADRRVKPVRPVNKPIPGDRQIGDYIGFQLRVQERGAFGVRRALIPLANSAMLFPALEGRRKLAGGGAKRNHRDKSKRFVRVPAGTPDRNSQQDQSRSGALSGRVVLSYRFRRLRFAPPPANFPRAPGAEGVCQQYQPSPL